MRTHTAVSFEMHVKYSKSTYIIMHRSSGKEKGGEKWSENIKILMKNFQGRHFMNISAIRVIQMFFFYSEE